MSNSGTIWIHAQFCSANGAPCGANSAGNNTTANQQMLRIIDSAGNPTLVIRGTGTAGQLKISSVVTIDTRAMNLYTLAPNGNGNATQWTGTNPCTAVLNAISFSDSSYIYTPSNSQIEECTVRNSIPAGNYNALAIVMSGPLLVGASGPQHFDFVTRTGGADYPSSDFAPTNSFGNIGNYIQTVNPATSSPWAVTDLTAAGFNIGLESKP